MTKIHLNLSDLGELTEGQSLAAHRTASRYSHTATVLHWALDLAIGGVFGVCLCVANQTVSLLRLKLFNWHKWAGMSLGGLSVLRLVWRLSHRPPALSARIATAMPTWQHWAHEATHSALNILFFAVPLFGWAYSSAFHIGQNEWADTTMVADDVQVKFKLALTGVGKF